MGYFVPQGKRMKWYEYLQSTKSHTAGEDVADSIALIVICALLYAVVFL
jgi:hypothetical protein